MTPIKPKKLSKKDEAWLRSCATEYPAHARILAALEYERQRADTAGHKEAAAVASLKRRQTSNGPWSTHFE